MIKSIKANSTRWKKILSLVRHGDYAHAGEEEAIQSAFAGIPKNSSRKLLDVGCGLGGTADFVQRSGWGHVTGIDIDRATIEYAMAKHPHIPFFTCDVVNLPQVITSPVDLIYLFNAFYSFPNQHQALHTMRQVSTSHATLIIFDYVDRGGYVDVPPHPFIPHPIHPENIQMDLAQTGWRLTAERNMDTEYCRWYGDLVNRIQDNKEDIVRELGESDYSQFHSTYAALLESCHRGILGGACLTATAA